MSKLARENSKTIIFGMTGSGKTTLTRILSEQKKRLIVIDPMQDYDDDCLFIDPFDNIVDLANYLKEHMDNQFRVSMCEDDKAEAVLSLAWIIQDVCVVIEEVDLICSPTSISKNFANVIKRGRKYGIELICNSRRPAEVNRLLTSQASDIYCFQTKEPGDISYLQKYTSCDFIEIVRDLKPLSFIHYPSMKQGYISQFKTVIWKD